MKKIILLSFFFILQSSLWAGLPQQPEMVLPDWTGEHNDWMMPIELDLEGICVIAPVSPIKGNFLISFSEYAPFIELRPGIEGLGFTTTEEGTVSRDSHLKITISQPLKISLTPIKVMFPVGAGMTVPLTLLYAHLLGQPLPFPEIGVPLVEEALKKFFGNDRTLQNFSYSKVTGYREENSLGGDSIWLFFSPPAAQ